MSGEKQFCIPVGFFRLSYLSTDDFKGQVSVSSESFDGKNGFCAFPLAHMNTSSMRNDFHKRSYILLPCPALFPHCYAFNTLLFIHPAIRRLLRVRLVGRTYVFLSDVKNKHSDCFWSKMACWKRVFSFVNKWPYCFCHRFVIKCPCRSLSSNACRRFKVSMLSVVFE